MAGAIVEEAVELVETGAGVAGTMGDVLVRVVDGVVAGGLAGPPCCAEASAVERIIRATGRKLEKDRRNITTGNVAENFKDARPRSKK